jgi:uncharacterized membrane protein
MADPTAPAPEPSPAPQPTAAGKTQALGLDYNIAALLCYLPVCGINLIASIVFLVSEPKPNKILRFHAVQSLLLMASSLVVSFFFGFLGGIVAAVAGRSGGSPLALLPSCLGGLVGLAVLVLAIIGMVKGYKLEMWKMPIIGNLADKWTS